MKILIHDLKEMTPIEVVVILGLGLSVILAIIGTIMKVMMYVKLWNHLS